MVYEVYLRSFADSDGDGVGDIGGLRGRLPYLADLGVDARLDHAVVPLADGRRRVRRQRLLRHRPAVRHLADADALLADAHALGLRVIIDLVANHTSDAAPLVPAALAAGPGIAGAAAATSSATAGRGGEEPPNDWISAFGGPAWTRVLEPDGRPGQWYLHLFAPQQPDLDWDAPGRRDEFDDVLRFWFDRGVDGIRVDAAPAMAKAPGLPDAGHAPGAALRVPHVGGQPALGRRRRARHPPALAGDRGRLRRRPGVRRRGRRQRPRAAEPLRAARRDAHARSTSTT